MKSIYDLPIKTVFAEEIDRQARKRGIGQINVLESIIREWFETSVFGGSDDEVPDSPLDQIEAKLERISGLK
ncbi:MAG: hypothetical protein RLZZ74_1210 [Cyanobacteriota bacterium]|jgi:hypothetical protein